MREITIGEKTLRLRGSALSLLHYQQEFGRDLLGDMVAMMTGLAGFQALASGGAVDPAKLDLSKLDSVALLRLVWTLARTAAGVGGQFPSFTRWLEEHEDIDIFDPDLLTAATEEATKIFFRRNKAVAPAAKG
jgi:hypothetical protein